MHDHHIITYLHNILQALTSCDKFGFDFLLQLRRMNHLLAQDRFHKLHHSSELWIVDLAEWLLRHYKPLYDEAMKFFVVPELVIGEFQ